MLPRIIIKPFFYFQTSENYILSSDTRSQLKFLEKLDQLEKQRKDLEEREILLKAAKVWPGLAPESTPGKEGRAAFLVGDCPGFTGLPLSLQDFF